MMNMNFQLEPAMALDNVRGLVHPTGVSAYSRAILLGGIALLEASCQSPRLEKFTPEIVCRIPCPALCNAYYKSGRIVFDWDPDKGFDEQFADAEQKGTARHGRITVTDAMADTILCLSRSRRFILQAVQAPAQKAGSGDEIPVEVISEIDDLFRTWDAWEPETRLDISKSEDIPCVPPNATPEELVAVMAKHDPITAYLLYLVLLHEFGHLMMRFDQAAREYLDFKSLVLLAGFRDGSLGDHFACDQFRALLRQPDIFHAWQTELAADIFALENSAQFLASESDSIAQVLAIMALIQSLVELYTMSRQSRFSRTHPVSFVRYALHLQYLHKNLEWGRRVAQRPDDQMDRMTNTILLLQMVPALREL